MRRPAQEIADALRTEIVSGRLKPGDQIPSEHELASQFQTTRTSAQKAVARLKAEGHLISEQGRGAFVRPRPSIRMLSTGINYRERRSDGRSNFNAEAAAQGLRAEQRIKEVGSVSATPEIAKRLGIAEGDEVVARRHEFWIGDEPAQLCDGYYPTPVAAGTPLELPANIPGGAHAVIEPGAGLAARRIVQFVEDLTVRMPTPDEVNVLRIPPGVPVVRIFRTAYDNRGQAVEVLDSVIPGDRHLFRYVIDVP